MAPQTDAATASSSSDFFFKSLSNDATNNTNTPSDQTANASPDASNNNRQQQPSSILAGLNAFDVDDAADGESSASANFADQLALWTNANFSFDGPTGHALLLDEDKDEGDGQNQSSGSGGNNASNAAAASGNDGDASAAQNGAAEPTHRDHKQQADQHQQSQYFAPPSSAAGEGRRPGWSTNHRDELARRNAENSTPNGTSGNGSDGSLPFSVGQNAFSAFASADDGRQQQQQVSAQPDQQQQHQQAAFIAPGGFPGMPAFSPELFQALAFQQLLSGAQQNGFGAQGLMGMSGFNPAFAASAGGFGGLAMPSQFMPPHIDVHAQHHQQQNQQPWQSSSSSRRETSDTPSDDELEDDSAKGKASSSSSKASGKKRRVSSSASNKSERSKAAAAAAAAEEAEIGRAAREEIPPLNLVDTGNPEADAEANRLAIEEDKRRRNTAASARFRIKKKAREQALEQTTKDLESRVKDLEEQNNRLSTENGWLKSLITIRPGGGPAAPGTIPFMPNAMAGMMPPHFKDAAQQMMMFNNAGGATSPGGSGNGNTSGSATGSTVQPSRDTGLRPRGVGTEAGSSGSSSRSSQSKGKRGRED